MDKRKGNHDAHVLSLSLSLSLSRHTVVQPGRKERGMRAGALSIPLHHHPSILPGITTQSFRIGRVSTALANHLAARALSAPSRIPKAKQILTPRWERTDFSPHLARTERERTLAREVLRILLYTYYTLPVYSIKQPRAKPGWHNR